MGIYAGPITVSKFYVRGTPPRGFKKRFVENIRLRAFRPLKPEDEDEERVGWCAAGDILDTDLYDENIFFGSYINLGIRIDKWRLPTMLLKAKYAQAAEAMLAKSGHERLSKTQKQDLRATVSAGLKRKLMPSMRLVDFCWDTEASEAFLWSQSPRMHDLLGMLFEVTFGLDLDVASPYLTASQLGLSEPRLDTLAALDPSPFHARKL